MRKMTYHMPVLIKQQKKCIFYVFRHKLIPAKYAGFFIQCAYVLIDDMHLIINSFFVTRIIDKHKRVKQRYITKIYYVNTLYKLHFYYFAGIYINIVLA